MRAAFIGLGNMGLGMARNLVRAGIRTTVFDIRSDAIAAATAGGASAAVSCAAAAVDVDAVCVAVFNDEQVRDVLTGTSDDPGVFPTARKGAVVILNSTISPTLVKELATQAREAGIELIDAAMTGGGDVAASEGTLSFMVGGSTDAVAKAKPVLDAMARVVFHVGPVGAGMSAKIVSNYLATTHVALVREALRLAAGAGIAESEILRIIEAGDVGSSWVSNNWQRIREQERSYTTGKTGMVEMWAKDLRLAQGLADSGGVSLPIADFIVASVVPTLGAAGLAG
jgi:3-hydroxyisobutyrate dehydrogenase-like beta-hydroxyacid dehydrogenase